VSCITEYIVYNFVVVFLSHFRGEFQQTFLYSRHLMVYNILLTQFKFKKNTGVDTVSLIDVQTATLGQYAFKPLQ
jgi:aminoglycoside/choline kinase family phosphotransferase